MSTPEMHVVGENLRYLIREKGYRTVELFCHENGINKGWFSRVLRGMTDPSLGRTIQIAKALGVSLNDIFSGKPQAKSRK